MTPKRLVIVLTALVLLGSVATPEGAGKAKPPKPAKLDRALAEAAARGDVDAKLVIVRTKPGQVDSLVARISAKGHVVRGKHSIIDGLSTSMTASQAALLAEDASIEGVSEDAVVRSNGFVEVGLAANSAAAATLVAAQSYTGAGVGVGVVDSGIDESLDVKNRITAFYDFTRGTAKKMAPHDEYGHGTFVAGAIGANGDLTKNEFRGVAPGVRLVGLRVLDNKGEGLTSNVIAAVEFAVLNRQALGIDVLNLSLGHPITEAAPRDPLVRAIEMASRFGIVVVVSAGNFGRDKDGQVGYMGITSPGNAPSAITVGAVKTFGTATYSDDRVADFSSRGPTWSDLFVKPDLVAPGHKIVSNGGNTRLYKNTRSSRATSTNNKPMLSLSGSSVSTALTSGAVALMIEANRSSHPGTPALTPNAVKFILEVTAVPVRNDTGAEYDPLTQGTGALNAVGAVSVAEVVNTSIPADSPMAPAALAPVTAVAGETLLWGQRLVWGDNYLVEAFRLVWGDSVYWACGLRWGSDIPGGTIGSDSDNDGSISDGISWTNHIVWGDKIVWGDGLVGVNPDGTHIVWGDVSWNTVDPNSLVWAPLGSSPLAKMATDSPEE